MKFEKIANRILAVFLLCVFVVPVILMNHQSGKISTAENRRLADFPKIYDTSGKLNPNLQAEFSSWFGDNLGMRDDYIKLSSNIQYKVLNKSSSQKVEIGRDGWFFYTMDNNMDIAKGKYPNFGEDMLADICDQQIKISNKLKEQGIDYVLVLPASKVSIYPEYIASGDYSVTRTPSDMLADYIETHSDVKVVRLKDALLKAKDSGQLYFKTDTHWNEYGAYIAYCEIIRKMNEWGMIDTPPADVTFYEGKYHGEMSAMLGDPNLLPDEDCPKSKITEPKAQKITSGERYDAFQNLLREVGNTNPCTTYVNNSIVSPKVLMYSDSLFGGEWNVREMLAENFVEYTDIYSNRIEQRLVDFFQPDIVLYEIGERYLNLLSQQSINFTQTPLKDFSSKVEAYEFKDGGLNVTVRNNSNSVWTRIDLVRLGLFINGTDASMRAMLPANVSIAPNDVYTFRFENVDMNYLLSNKTEAVMLQEGISYFAQKFPIISESEVVGTNDAEIISHDAPAQVSASGTYDIHITVKNTGTSAWRELSQHRLCIWQDGKDYGFRVNLPDGVTVKPGEEYTFTLSGFTGQQPEHTYLEFQMLQEGAEYFGEKERADIVAVK